uniref:Mitochondrial calcium uptake family member 3 n=1 Tax=Cyclopterus lumpus TaxID=8103 RepID=A0A8C2WCS9_CYCLU
MGSHIQTRIIGAHLHPSLCGLFKSGDVYMSSHEHRFRMFSSVEYEGQLYMTPQNFIESVTMSEPRSNSFVNCLIVHIDSTTRLISLLSSLYAILPMPFLGLELPSIHTLAHTHPMCSPLCSPEPHAGFKIAFNMFDADGNQMVDKREFLERLICKEITLSPANTETTFMEMDFTDESITIDTTLLVHFFGKKGKAELTFDDFYRFMDNLQTEVLEIEFLTYSKGMTTISEEDFAKILLRFTNVENISAYLENVRHCIPDEKGITFDEFRSFFQFLNNLEDFAIAMQMYNFASRSIGQDEFARAVYVATGLKLTRHLVHTIFKIFDVDHDDQLSYKEFIGIMKDRLHRGARVRNLVYCDTILEHCLQQK